MNLRSPDTLRVSASPGLMFPGGLGLSIVDDPFIPDQVPSFWETPPLSTLRETLGSIWRQGRPSSLVSCSAGHGGTSSPCSLLLHQGPRGSLTEHSLCTRGGAKLSTHVVSLKPTVLQEGGCSTRHVETLGVLQFAGEGGVAGCGLAPVGWLSKVQCPVA